MSVRIAAVVSLMFACGDPGGSDTGAFDSGVHDAEEREGGFPDAIVDGDASTDAGNQDATDGDVPLFDGGDGVLCEQAIAWPFIGAPLVATTSASIHRDRFQCAGVGGGSIAPERWVEARFDQPTHAIVRLGTAGWDAVM